MCVLHHAIQAAELLSFLPFYKCSLWLYSACLDMSVCLSLSTTLQPVYLLPLMKKTVLTLMQIAVVLGCTAHVSWSLAVSCWRSCGLLLTVDNVSSRQPAMHRQHFGPRVCCVSSSAFLADLLKLCCRLFSLLQLATV